MRSGVYADGGQDVATPHYSDDVGLRLASSERSLAAGCHYFSCVSPPLLETSNLHPS